jgi:hypothetical protein
MNLKKISLLTAGFALAGWVHSIPASANDWCSDLSVSVTAIPAEQSDYKSQWDVEVRTNVSPARQVNPREYRKALMVIEVEYEAEGGPYYHGRNRSFIRHQANWGSFSSVKRVPASGPIKAIRVVNAQCEGVLRF